LPAGREELARGFRSLAAGIALFMIMITLALASYLNTTVNPGKGELALILLSGLLGALLVYRGLSRVGRALAGGQDEGAPGTPSGDA